MKAQLAVAALLLSVFSTTPSASLAEASRTVTLDTSKNPAVYGSGFVLSGRVTTSDGSKPCRNGVQVSIIRDSYDDIPYDWSPVVRVTTDETGRFRAALMAENSATYRAELPATLQCAADQSRRVTVRSRVRLTLEPLVARIQRGEVVTLVARARPRCDEVMYLQKLVDGRFVRVAAQEPNERCVATFRRHPRGDRVFRAVHREIAGAGFFYLGNRSGLSAVSVSD